MTINTNPESKASSQQKAEKLSDWLSHHICITVVDYRGQLHLVWCQSCAVQRFAQHLQATSLPPYCAIKHTTSCRANAHMELKDQGLQMTTL